MARIVPVSILPPSKADGDRPHLHLRYRSDFESSSICLGEGARLNLGDQGASDLSDAQALSDSHA